jgi:hypothetical protein
MAILPAINGGGQRGSKVLGGKPFQNLLDRGSGWRDAQPLTSPPGVALADALMDQQDKIDLAERAEKLMKAEALQRAKASQDEKSD